MSNIENFSELGLKPAILKALEELGYETPTPIQAKSIPVLLQGENLLAQAQTGTGKTASFALPILNELDPKQKSPQALVIAPTRELAIQVAEAFYQYAKHLKDFHVTPIYGGQDYNVQFKALKRGSQVVVGTPGRLIDHLERGTLNLENLKTIVLDEADEMLKMGFIDDIESILQKMQPPYQMALFSATMPKAIEKIADRYLSKAQKIHIQPKERTVNTIEQVYMCVKRENKLDALTRFLEIDNVTAGIIFVRTKTMCVELGEKLQARGYRVSALNGDMKQSMRERVIDQLKKGTLDFIVATDVAARGIDVQRVSHVINYDIPTDTESYIHRIGRTGRAGRTGKALLLVTPREQRLLNDIERAIHCEIKPVTPPTLQEISSKRSEALAEKVLNIVSKSKKLKPYQEMVAQMKEHCPVEDIAAALAYLLEQDNPLPIYDLENVKPEKPQGKTNNTNKKNKNRTFEKSRSSKNKTEFKKRVAKRKKSKT
jgi:ATP-dependent RNA helicase DeaD